MTPFLTDPEIDEICSPLTQPAAQIRYLESIGLIVKRKPNGRPMVGRRHYEDMMSGKHSEAARPDGPNMEALMKWAERA